MVHGHGMFNFFELTVSAATGLFRCRSDALPTALQMDLAYDRHGAGLNNDYCQLYIELEGQRRSITAWPGRENFADKVCKAKGYRKSI